MKRLIVKQFWHFLKLIKKRIPSVLEFARVNYELNYTKKALTQNDLFDTSFYDSLA